MKKTKIFLKYFRSFTSKSSLSLFFIGTFLAALCHILPWSKGWSIFEYALLFSPRWLIFVLLIPVSFLDFKLIQKHKITLGLCTFFLVFFYLNVELPIKIFVSVAEKPNLRVMTTNLGGIGNLKNNYKLRQQIKYSRVDLVAFQEVSAINAERSIPNKWNIECIVASCIASSYDIKPINSISRSLLGGWGNIGALFQLDIKGKAIYVLNIHLETPRKGIEDFQLSTLNLDPIFNNAQNRFLEANIVRDWVNMLSPLIILGDFNMPIESSIYRGAFSKYKNAFNEAGFGLGHTKHTKLIGVRIDHILVDDHFNVVNSWVGNDIGGDHRAVFADIRLTSAL